VPQSNRCAGDTNAGWIRLGHINLRLSHARHRSDDVYCDTIAVKHEDSGFSHVGRVLRLSRANMLRKVIIPATLPYIFTGWRLSLGIAWLVIVASEMLTGAPGIGGFL
jgi:hypothetical protein